MYVEVSSTPRVRDSSGKPAARYERGLAAYSPTPARSNCSSLIKMQKGRGHALIKRNYLLMSFFNSAIISSFSFSMRSYKAIFSSCIFKTASIGLKTG